MTPGIIIIAVIIILLIVFAKFIYPEIIKRKHIDFFEKAEKFLDTINISYNDADIVYAEKNKSAANAAAKFGKQMIFGLSGVQDYSEMIKYIVVYNNKHIIMIPMFVNEFNGNIMLCEENDDIIYDISVSEISYIDINNSLFTVCFKDKKKTLLIPDQTPSYMEQAEFKNKFMEFMQNLRKSAGSN